MNEYSIIADDNVHYIYSDSICNAKRVIKEYGHDFIDWNSFELRRENCQNSFIRF